MSKQKKYNTAVIATDKNGNTTKYASLEEAARASAREINVSYKTITDPERIKEMFDNGNK